MVETGGAEQRVSLDIPAALGVQRVVACNLVEDVERELPLEDGRLTLSFRPFEIKSILLETSAPIPHSPNRDMGQLF